MKNIIFNLFILIVSCQFISCTTVKEYQKGRLNDSEMMLSNRKIEKTEMSFQTYIEKGHPGQARVKWVVAVAAIKLIIIK